MNEQQVSTRFFDVGVNLADPVFRGQYNGSQRHPDDLKRVLERAREAGCQKLMITGSDLEQSQKAIELAQEFPNLCYATVGIHPCAAKEFGEEPNGIQRMCDGLNSLLSNNKLRTSTAAFGEFGLDYDRLGHCPRDIQLRVFESQLNLAVNLSPQLPLFLHSRAAHEDFVKLLKLHLPRLKPRSGLVHSFTGTIPEMQELVELGLDIGVNGCSLKTEENLEVVKAIPLERMQLETDAPWCEIRPSSAGRQRLEAGPKGIQVDEEEQLPFYSAKQVKKEKWTEKSMVKGRNEPCTIGVVARVVARVKEVSEREVVEAAWNNSMRMFVSGIPRSDEGNKDNETN